MLKLRFRRTGAKKQPSYRLVVAESTAPRDGTFLENLGHYNPQTTPTTFVIKEERIREWLSRGAQPTERVARLLTARGIITAPTATATAPTSAAATARTSAATEPTSAETAGRPAETAPQAAETAPAPAETGA